MNIARNSAQIIDLQSYRAERASSSVAALPVAPMVVWVPVWVMMPQSPTS